ncbi:MAG TPA: divergent polysaccharide deacetylase family protein [bacterium]
MIAPWKIRLFWTQLILAAILICVRVLDRPEPGFNFLPPLPKKIDYGREEAIRRTFYEVCFNHGIRVDWISGDSQNKIVRIPIDLPMVDLYMAMAARFREAGGQLVKTETDPQGYRMALAVGVDDQLLMQVTMRSDFSLARVAGRIAIVIDDFGYTFNSLIQDFLDLEYNVTFSIIPGLKHSVRIADAATERQRSVMMHLPMEPKNGKIDRDEFVLLTGMSEKEIRERVRLAVKAVPHIKGLNNHMGSLATEDEALLSIMMDEVKKTGLFFLDSRTDANTRAYASAQKLKIPTAINDVFLDAIREEPFIRQQLNLVAEIAARNGTAVAIGHPEELTLKVLQEELPILVRKGFSFVNVSDVVK